MSGLGGNGPHRVEWTPIPVGDREIDAVVRHCRRTVSRHALLAAGVAAVPVPGIDWLTDIAVLVKLLGLINRAFGLSPEQVERLSPDRRVVVYKALSAAGGLLVGRVITRELAMAALRMVGVRLSAQQAAKFVPLAGQAVSAVLTYSALRFVCEQHIRQCAEVARSLTPPVSGGVVQRLDETRPAR